MSSPNDPIRMWRKRLWLVWALGGSLLIACSTWAWFPMETLESHDHAPISKTVRPSTNDQSALKRAPINLDLFTAKLWNEPPPKKIDTPVAPTRVASIPPPKLQLIGITTEGDIRYAALYDNQTDRLYVVRDGDQILQYTVASVTDKAVHLKAENREHTIELISIDPVQARNGRRS